MPRKNIIPLLGKPLIAWSIDAALKSRFLGAGSVFVSTEDDEISRAARAAGAKIVNRPVQLAESHVWTEPVIRHAIETIEKGGLKIDVIAWMNACVPELMSWDIDHAFQRLFDEGLREVITVDKAGRANSAVRVLHRETLYQNRLSAGFAVLSLDYVDINTEADLKRAEAKLRNRLWITESKS